MANEIRAEEQLRRVLAEARTAAVLGAHPRPERPALDVFRRSEDLMAHLPQILAMPHRPPCV